jgi:hypothetical protein
MTEVPEKPCSKCGDVKPLSEFYRHHRSKDGHQWWCKTCFDAGAKERQAAQRARNPEAQRAAVRRHRERTGNKTGKEYGRAKRMATKRLVAAYEVEFKRYLVEELAKIRGTEATP